MAYSGVCLRASATISGVDPDAAGDTYSLGEGYPTTRGGLTFGFVGGAVPGMRDRNTTGDSRTAGIHFSGNTGVPDSFRLDLPGGPGTYLVRAAFGDGGSGQTQFIRLKDGTTTFATPAAAASTGVNEYIDAGGTLRTSRALWAANNVSVTRTFAAGYLTIEMGDPASSSGDSSTLAYVGVEAVGGGGGSTLRTKMMALLLRGRN